LKIDFIHETTNPKTKKREDADQRYYSPFPAKRPGAG